MNIEAYDTETLRKIVRLLEYENRLLKDKLKKENIPYDEINPFEETIENAEEYDLDQGARIVHPTFITERMSMPGAARMAVIFHNVIIDGMLNFVRNSVEKRYFAMRVKIKNGQNWT